MCRRCARRTLTYNSPKFRVQVQAGQSDTFTQTEAETMKTRDEHLQWAKANARKYLEKREVANAIASMCLDLQEHPDFESILKIMEPLGLLYAMQNDFDGACRFVEGFR